MENPATWTPTIKLINRSFHTEGMDAGTSVITALKAENLLKETSPVLDKALIYIINKAFDHHQELIKQRFCGRSLGGTVNDLLASLGAI